MATTANTPTLARYRVDIFLVLPEIFAPYSADKIDLDFALSLFQHLQRNKTGCRVVLMPSEKVIQEWKP